MHTSTFLKVAGKAQGTLYKEVETEVLLIWKKILKDTGINPGHIVFSESRSKKIIHFPNELFTKKLLSTDCGNILIYIK
jgi:hypothetical protein